MAPDLSSHFIIQQSEMIVRCYQQTTGESLHHRLGLTADLNGQTLATQLYQAAAVILSHDIVINGARRDNVYNYANQRAQDVFERSFSELTSLASSHSTGATDQAQQKRNELLAQSLAHGFVKFHSSRQSATGKEIVLNNAVLFVLFDTEGLYRGQAVVFDA